MKLKEFIENVIWTVGVLTSVSAILALGVMSLIICLLPDAPMEAVWLCGIVAFIVIFGMLLAKGLTLQGKTLRLPRLPSIKAEIERHERYKAVMRRYDRIVYLKSLKRNKLPARDFDIPLYIFNKKG